MVTYWCVWCGATTERRTSHEAPQCTRCITEFQVAFGFPLRTLMIPLEGSSPPGVPGAAYKRFNFVDQKGREVWTTSTPFDDDVDFNIYDVGA